MNRIVLVMFLALIPATGFSQYGNLGNVGNVGNVGNSYSNSSGQGNAGNGYSNTSGQGNGVGNGNNNAIKVSDKKGKDCYSCISSSDQSKKWHPPLVYPKK